MRTIAGVHCDHYLNFREEKMKYWLFKCDPEEFSWEDLLQADDQTTYWDGVRNYQARNFLRDEIQVGDLVLFYHSQVKPMAIQGIAEVVRAGYPDFTALDAAHDHYDPKSSEDKPTWYMVDIQWKESFDPPLTRERLAKQDELEGMELLRRGSRLSIQPVKSEHFDFICKLARER